MLRPFDSSSPLLEDIVTSNLTEEDCKLYCASKKSCCGCTMLCNVTCQWNALTDCERAGNVTPVREQCTSRKPGKSIRTCG